MKKQEEEEQGDDEYGDEKVCLTGGQIENISKAYAKEHPHQEGEVVCSKAEKWVKGFFKDPKKRAKPKKAKVDTMDQAGSWLERKLTRKIKAKLEEFF